ncbi:MAG: DUF2834 domain-containing protein [Myxococcota bacterium]
MSDRLFAVALLAVGAGFAVFFVITMGPPFVANPDVVGAFAAGFVNPYATGYSVDTVCCWLLLAILVVRERSKVRHGWVCLLLGIVPGVATGFALYLYLRSRALKGDG